MSEANDRYMAEVDAVLMEIDPRAVAVFRLSENLSTMPSTTPDQPRYPSWYSKVYLENGQLYSNQNNEIIRGFTFIGNPPVEIDAVITDLGTYRYQPPVREMDEEISAPALSRPAAKREII